MLREADVVVIGGGLSGASIAYHLARAGRKVVVLEKGELASGASRASFGWIAVHFASYMPEYPDYHMRLMRAGLDAYDDLLKDFAEAIEYVRTGGVSLIYSDEEWAAQAGLAARLTAAGLDAHLVPRDELRRREPVLAGPFLGGLMSPLEGLVNPLRLVKALAREAARLGAELLTATPAVGILVRHGAVTGVETPRGTIRTPAVVNAAGVDAPGVGRMVGLELPVYPNRGQQLIVQGRAGLLGTTVHGRALIRPTRAGHYLVGGVREAAGYDNRVTAAGLASLAREITTMIPELGAFSVTRAFSGLRPVPGDGKPIYGPVPGLRGYFLANLHFGLTLAPLTGRILASLVLGEEPEVDLAPYRVDRFG